MSKPLTPAQAKKRLVAFEKQVYNPACAFIEKHIPEDEYEESFSVTDFHIALSRLHSYFLAQAREPQECPQERDAAPL